MKTEKNKFDRFGKKSVLNKEFLANIKGGTNGSGWISSLSGDCNQSGTSCWKILNPRNWHIN